MNITHWTNALRSGVYEQGTGCLENEGRNCCLGVAAKVCGEPVRNPTFNDVMGSLGSYHPIAVTLIPEGLDQDDLVSKNDAQGYSFDEIAGYLDQYAAIELDLVGEDT